MGDLVGKLVEFGFTSSVETRTFAADIYAKVPRRSSSVSVRFDCPAYVVRSIFQCCHSLFTYASFCFAPELPEAGEGGSKTCPETEHLQAVV